MLEQITLNNSNLQDYQTEWPQCSIWTAGLNVRIILGLKNWLLQDIKASDCFVSLLFFNVKLTEGKLPKLNAITGMFYTYL